MLENVDSEVGLDQGAPLMGCVTRTGFLTYPNNNFPYTNEGGNDTYMAGIL